MLCAWVLHVHQPSPHTQQALIALLIDEEPDAQRGHATCPIITQRIRGLPVSPYPHALVAAANNFTTASGAGEGVICVRTSGAGFSRSLLDQEEEPAQSTTATAQSGVWLSTVGKTYILTSRGPVSMK